MKTQSCSLNNVLYYKEYLTYVFPLSGQGNQA